MKIQKQYKDELELTEKIVHTLLSLSDRTVSKKELELLSFLSYHGDITSQERKEEFYKRYKTTYNTLTNLISTLKKKGLVNKINDDVKSVFNLPVNGTILNLQINVQQDNRESSSGE